MQKNNTSLARVLKFECLISFSPKGRPDKTHYMGEHEGSIILFWRVADK